MRNSTRWAGFSAFLAAGLFMVMAGLGSPAGAQGEVDDPAQVDAGMVVFETNCAGCHGADGTGSATGRPLIDVADEADRAQHVATVTDGRGNMPAFGERLSAEEIDASVSYVRLTFVTEEEAVLAVTGPTSTPLVIVGLTLLLAGLVVAAFARSLAVQTD